MTTTSTLDKIRRVAVSLLVMLAFIAPGLSGAGQLAATGPTLKRGAAIPAAVSPKAASAVAQVVEYYHADLDNYFITADPLEQAAVDGGAAGAFMRTGDGFSPGGPNKVCRFYGNSNVNPATGATYGPNSHFYTADAAECAALKAQFDPNAKSWKFESDDFLTTSAVNGTCPANLAPVYRAYNNGFAKGIDSNHRITTNNDAYQKTIARGWIGEGIVMCAPKPVDSSVLPSQLPGCDESDCPASATSLGNGPDLVDVIVEIANTGTTTIDLVIPAGQTFLSVPPTFQDGLAIERLQASIAPGTTAQFVLHLFCLNQDRSASHAGAIYSPGPITSNPQLLDVVALAAGKLGESLDPSSLKRGGVQFAIWEITNGTGALSAAQRALLVSLLGTAADDLMTQATLYQQFQETLSFQF